MAEKCKTCGVTMACPELYDYCKHHANARIKELEAYCETMMEQDEVDSIIEYRDRMFAEKDSKIKELEAENERLKEGLSNAYPITDQEMGRV